MAPMFLNIDETLNRDTYTRAVGLHPSGQKHIDVTLVTQDERRALIEFVPGIKEVPTTMLRED